MISAPCWRSSSDRASSLWTKARTGMPCLSRRPATRRPVDPLRSAGCACNQNRVRHWKVLLSRHRMIYIILWIQILFVRSLSAASGCTVG